VAKNLNEDLSMASNGPMVYSKDLFVQVKPKHLANQVGVSLLMDKSLLTYRSFAQMSENPIQPETIKAQK
jgi:hypothetical protein